MLQTHNEIQLIEKNIEKLKQSLERNKNRFEAKYLKI